MTAFFATAEQFTATAAQGAVIDYVPLTQDLSSGLFANAGARISMNTVVDLFSPLVANAGKSIVWQGIVTLVPVMSVSGGALVQMNLNPLDFIVTPYNIRAGASVPFVTSTPTIAFPPTAAFSTTLVDYIIVGIDVPFYMTITGPVDVRAGATVPVQAVTVLEYDPHGPVARPRAIQAQLIMN